MPVELSYTCSVLPWFVLATSICYTCHPSISSSYSESLEITFQRSVCNYEQHFIDVFLVVCATDFMPLWTNACYLLSPVCRGRVLRSYPRILAKISATAQWQLSLFTSDSFTPGYFSLFILPCA